MILHNYTERRSIATNPPAGAVDPAALRLRLREATAGAHAALDGRFEHIGHAAPLGYHQFVRMNHACYLMLEAWLAGVLPQDVQAMRPDHTADLRADMAAMALTALEPAPLPFAEPHLSEAAGVLYVIDGSRLGARYILRELAARQGSTNDRLSVRYLTAAAVAGPVFAGFDQLAARLCARDIEHCISGALKAFGLYLAMSRLAVETT